jgi:hypothetical protein
MDGFGESTVTEEEVYAGLPADSEQAFVILEKFYREQCELKLARVEHSDHDVRVIYVDYISKVIAAITELGLEAKFQTKIPRINEVSFETYAEFGKDVQHYRTMLQIRQSRRNKGYSVQFDSVTKQKIRHHIEQVRTIIEKLEVNQDKKEDLLKKLDVFAAEVDRDRTRYEAWAAVLIQAAEVFGEAAEKAEPARRWLDTIGRIIWGAKCDEETKQLAPPREVKRIEPPKKSDMDDEIPF